MLTANGWTVLGTATVLLVAGTALGYGELLVAAVGLVLAFVPAVIVLRRRPELLTRRDIRPARVTEGDPASATVSVTNTGSITTPPLNARERFGDEDLAVQLPILRPGADHSVTYALPTTRRGIFPVGPLTLTYADPLRLLQVVQAQGARSTLIVHPKLYRASPIPTGKIRELDGAENNTAQRGGVAFHSLREYVPGDDLRLIHWRSSAKTGTLLVRHNVVTYQPRLCVVLDTSALSYESIEHFDDAVRVAASLVVAGVDAHYPTVLATTGGYEAEADHTGRGRTGMLDAIAGVEPDVDDPGLAALVGMADIHRGMSLGVVTGRPMTEHARGVARVRGRFEAVTVVQLGVTASKPALSIAGAIVLGCEDPDHFETVWKQRVG